MYAIRRYYGIDPPTLKKTRTVFKQPHPEGLSAEEVGQQIGASRTTARRYLEYLTAAGQLRAEFRITSYNVCYTKLLRDLHGALVDDLLHPGRRGACVLRAQVRIAPLGTVAGKAFAALVGGVVHSILSKILFCLPVISR